MAEAGLSWEQIAAHRDGLICLSGGRQGWVDRFLVAGETGAAQAFAARLAGTFDDDACLALEMDGAARCSDGRPSSPGSHGDSGMPLVAVHPIYCLSPEDAPRLRLLAAIRANRPLDAGAPKMRRQTTRSAEDETPSMWRRRGRPAGASRPERSAKRHARATPCRTGTAYHEDDAAATG